MNRKSILGPLLIILAAIIVLVFNSCQSKKNNSVEDDSSNIEVTIEPTDELPDYLASVGKDEQGNYTYLEMADGRIIYDWYYFADKFEEVEDEQINRSIFIKTYDDAKKDEIVSRIQENLNDFDANDQVASLDKALEIFKDAKQLLISDGANKDSKYFKVGDAAYDYIRCVYKGEDGEPSSYYEKLVDALNLESTNEDTVVSEEVTEE